MTRITPEQQALLTSVTSARAAFVNTRTTVEARIRARLEAELREVEAVAKAAVLTAHQAGIPKSQIGAAYGTKDAGTINRIIAEAQEEQAMPLMPVEPFTISVDSDVYTVKVNSLMLGEDLVEDATIRFELDEIGFPVFTDPVDPWENSQPRKIGVLARQIQMGYNSEHPLNKSIRAAKS